MTIAEKKIEGQLRELSNKLAELDKKYDMEFEDRDVVIKATNTIYNNIEILTKAQEKKSRLSERIGYPYRPKPKTEEELRAMYPYLYENI